MTLALAMIVKNEEHVIRRCLASVRPFVDSWIIVDTGSEDNTIATIYDEMSGIPGDVVSKPWVNFAHNRNESIDLAAAVADYILVIDADDTLTPSDSFIMPPLTADAYELLVHYNELRYRRPHIFRSDRGFRYTGVVHEVLVSPTAKMAEPLDGLVYTCIGGGGRSHDPQKYAKDALLLEEELRRDPTDARTAFYLAQSYRDSDQTEKAIAAYEHRANMPGWEEETFVALLERAKLIDRSGASIPDITEAYMRAFESRPTRAEPLTYLARSLRQRDHIKAAFPYALAAVRLPMPSDRLFVEAPIYEWIAIDEAAVSAYWVGLKHLSRDMNSALLLKDLPESEVARVKDNLEWCKKG